MNVNLLETDSRYSAEYTFDLLTLAFMSSLFSQKLYLVVPLTPRFQLPAVSHVQKALLFVLTVESETTFS